MKRSAIGNLVILAGAFFAYLKLGLDKVEVIPPSVIPPSEPPPTLPVLPDRYTECPAGQYRKLIDGQWRCWVSERPGGR